MRGGGGAGQNTQFMNRRGGGPVDMPPLLNQNQRFGPGGLQPGGSNRGGHAGFNQQGIHNFGPRPGDRLMGGPGRGGYGLGGAGTPMGHGRGGGYPRGGGIYNMERRGLAGGDRPGDGNKI
jgi:hypothetical protein